MQRRSYKTNKHHYFQSRWLISNIPTTKSKMEGKMANEFNNALKTAAEKIAKYVDNVSTLTVITRLVDVEQGAQGFDSAKPAAKTIICLDGDCSVVLPMRLNAEGSPVVDTAVFELHEQNVATAIEYRTRMMDALLQTFQQTIRP
jgi:hypothetical protein